MKRLVATVAVCASLVIGSAAFASDGEALYKSCRGCHGTDGGKLAMGVGAPIKGQSSDELLTKLKGYADGSYGDSKKKIMTNIVKRFNDEQLKMLADYIATF